MSKSQNSHYTSLRKDYPRTWRIWYRMCYRCNNDCQDSYVDVSVCDEWNYYESGEEGFINFLDEMGPSEKDLEIDRINPFGNYEPGNCRWVDQAVNRQNKRMQLDGSLDMLNLAKKNGINPHTFYSRINNHGWHPQDAATLPPSPIKYKKRTI